MISFSVMQCSLNVIPQTKDLLNKSRLPLGVLIHPFKDLEVKQFFY
jgi:protein transport protein SEC24